MRTPWFASKYGVEKPTTFSALRVIVTSSNAKSYFFGAGEKRPPKGERRNSTFEIFSCFAIACESWRTSKPVGFLMVVPDALPFQKPGAGKSKPTMSFPGSFVGGALCAEAVTATTALAPSAAAITVHFTTSLLFGDSRPESTAPTGSWRAGRRSGRNEPLAPSIVRG